MGKLASSITYHSREVEHRKLQRFRRSHANTTKLKEVPSSKLKSIFCLHCLSVSEANFNVANLPSHIVVTTPPRSSSPFFEAFHGNIMPRNLSFQQSPSQPFHRMKLESLIKRHQQGSDNAISSGFVPPKLYHEILNKILPSNVVSRILLCLDFEDIFHLSLTCRTARILLKDPSICKSILEVCTASSLRLPLLIYVYNTSYYEQALNIFVYWSLNVLSSLNCLTPGKHGKRVHMAQGMRRHSGELQNDVSLFVQEILSLPSSLGLGTHSFIGMECCATNLATRYECWTYTTLDQLSL
jgi:hypothetical protein